MTTKLHALLLLCLPLGSLVAQPSLRSNPINILVERADSPISIIVYPTIADFTMDQKRYFSVTGTYADCTGRRNRERSWDRDSRCAGIGHNYDQL